MATLSLAFNLSASAVGMAQGINAGVVELQKLGVAAKKTAADVGTLKTIELSRAFISTARATAGALSEFVGGTSGAVARISDLAERTGIAASTLQGYALAANQSGVELDTFATAVQKLTINLGEAQTGNANARKSFAELGLSVADLSKQRPEQAFESVVAAISKLPNPAQQAAAAVSLFGKSGIALTPIFQQGAGFLQQMAQEASRLGITLSPQQFRGIAELDDSLGKARLTIQGFAARLLAEMAPALTRASEAASTFIGSLDIKTIAVQVSSAITDLARSFGLVAQYAIPLAGNLLPAIGGYLAFINRQAIAAGIAGLARAFLATASAAVAYSTGALTASAATATLATSVRGLLASTGIGALAVVLGLAAGALADWALSGKESAQEITIAVQDPTKGVEEFNKSLQASIGTIQNVGREAKAAFNLDDVLDTGVTQTFIDQAQEAFKALAVQLNGVAAIPEDLQAQFAGLQDAVDALNADRAGGIVTASSENAVVTQAQRLLAAIQSITEARKRDADAAKDAADAAKRAADEARQRTRELATSGLTESEKSRLQLNKDLLAITQEQRAAEEALAAAKRAVDAEGIKAARERLTLAQSAVVEAKAQDRDRQLQALGIDQRILQPARTIADEFQAVRDAFNQEFINPEQFGIALRNLADEGIKIRGELARELSKPAQRALEVSDIRTPEGIRQFMALSRQDPAIEQRAQQLQKLDEIRKELIKINVQPVDILS